MDSDYYGSSGPPSKPGKATAKLRPTGLALPLRAGFLEPPHRPKTPQDPPDFSPLSLLDAVPERPRPCVWAAEIGGLVVGTIGLIPTGQHSARIHWLHIEPDWQHTGILAKLLRQLYDYCQSQGYGRVALNPQIAPPWIWRLLVRCGFRLLRRIRGPRGELLEFALNRPVPISNAPQPSRS